LAARTLLVWLDLEADLARREVRLRVGAMIAMCWEFGGDGVGGSFFVKRT
jgi:hypothetical protein